MSERLASDRNPKFRIWRNRDRPTPADMSAFRGGVSDLPGRGWPVDAQQWRYAVSAPPPSYRRAVGCALLVFAILPAVTWRAGQARASDT
jgi:hypothetical protein